jgi:RNA polymerase subunit RPABC4/transcription elongation factor Spt4
MDEDDEGPETCLHCGAVVVSEFEYCPNCGKKLHVMKIPASSYVPQSAKNCERCAKPIESTNIYCPYCGHKQGAPIAQAKERSGGYFLTMYLLSFLIPIIGIVLWISWSRNTEGEWRTRGTACLAAACIGLVMYIILISFVI